MNTHADKTQENKSQSVANEVSQKRSGGESSFQFVDNRPEAVAQKKLQEIANNSPLVKQMRTNQEMTNNIPEGNQSVQLQVMVDNYTVQQQQPFQKKENEVNAFQFKVNDSEAITNRKQQENTNTNILRQGAFQRMVAVAEDDMNKVDEFILLSHINYAHTKAGGTIAEVKNMDFSKIGENESLFIVNHGAPGKVGKLTSNVVLGYLTDSNKGLPKSYRGTIFLSSCFSAETSVPGVPSISVPASLLTDIKSGLLEDGYKGIDVIGAKGSSITNFEVTPNERPVVNPENVVKTKGTGGETAMDVQKRLENKIYSSGKTTQEQVNEWLLNNSNADIKSKAKKAAEISKTFYTKFIKELSTAGMLQGIGKGYTEELIPSTYKITLTNGSGDELGGEYEYVVRLKSTKREIGKEKLKSGSIVSGTGNSEILIKFSVRDDLNSWIQFTKSIRHILPGNRGVDIDEQ